MAETKENATVMGEKTAEAAKFLRDYLSEGRKSTNSVIEEAEKHGISMTTIGRVRKAVGIKAQKTKEKWYMSMPPSAKEKIEEVILRPYKKRGARRRFSDGERYEISNDWITVVTVERGQQENAGARIEISVGKYRVAVGAEYPTEKLAELLRLFEGGDAGC